MTIQYVRDPGVVPGSSGVSDNPGLTPTNLAMRNVGTASATIVLFDAWGAKSEPISLQAGSPFLLDATSVQRYEINGNGAKVIIYMGWPDRFHPEYFTETISGTVNTDIGQSNLYAKDANSALIVAALNGGLPGALDPSGGLKVAIVSPIDGATGGVKVHSV